jgi:hypothetical protein
MTMSESFPSRIDPTELEDPHDEPQHSRERALVILVWAILLHQNGSPATGRGRVRVAGSAWGKAALLILQRSWALEQASSSTLSLA